MVTFAVNLDTYVSKSLFGDMSMLEGRFSFIRLKTQALCWDGLCSAIVIINFRRALRKVLSWQTHVM